MDEYTTASGKVVRVGQLYRDSRKSNVRTLRVDGLTDQHGVVRANCLVVRQEHEGTIAAPMRFTAMDAERLASRVFVLAEEQ